MNKISQKEYKNRRKKLFSSMDSDSILIINGESEKTRNNDVNYEFRQDSNFWYFTGIEEPESTMILQKKDSEKYILFTQEKKVEEDSVNVNYENLPLKSLNAYINSEIRQGEFLLNPLKSFEKFKNWYQLAVNKSIEKVKRPETKEKKRFH